MEAQGVCRALGTLFLSLTFWVGPAQAIDTEEDCAWKPLFNGKDLSGWIPKLRGFAAGENPHDTFRVQDGLLTVAYDGYTAFDNQFGHLFYEKSWSRYRLRLDYRFIGEQVAGGPDWAWRNSGVMLHSPSPILMPEAQDFPVSIEVQLLGGRGDGSARSTANLCTPGSTVFLDGKFDDRHCIESGSATFDGDQWVHLEVLVLGDQRVVHTVNGEQVLEYSGLRAGGGAVSGNRPELTPDDSPLAEGYLSLQAESHPVQFRNIELLNLVACPRLAP